REYLSVTTGRVLAHLAELRTALNTHQAGVDDLDAVLADFAAFAGLWHESIVRGPAWRIGDTGRRLERALVVVDLVEAAVDGGWRAPAGSADVEAAVVEVLLAANESLVAYRRRHRSDVELEAAISLLIHDDTNPRSLVSAIDRLERHAVESDWPVERELAERARTALALPLGELLPAARAVIDQAGVRVIERWFSAPVSPVVLRPTEVETS
ncbi:MAG TPA: alpha-E domain-containing protein, partial [Ilumatobacter sp.]